MWWKKPFINWDAHPRRVDHNQSQTITNGQKLVGSLPCSNSYTLLCCKVWRPLNRCRHSQAELKKIVEQDTFASIREAPGKCGFPNSRNTKCRRDKHNQPLFGVMWLSHFVWGFFSRIYTFWDMGYMTQPPRAGWAIPCRRDRRWWWPWESKPRWCTINWTCCAKFQGWKKLVARWNRHWALEKLVVLCCVFLVPGSFCSEWRARWRELLAIHILYSMGNKERLRVTRFVSYSL